MIIRWQCPPDDNILLWLSEAEYASFWSQMLPTISNLAWQAIVLGLPTSSHTSDESDWNNRWEICGSSQLTQNFCITFLQRRPNVEEVLQMLYNCFVLCGMLLPHSKSTHYFLHINNLYGNLSRNFLAAVVQKQQDAFFLCRVHKTLSFYTAWT